MSIIIDEVESEIVSESGPGRFGGDVDPSDEPGSGSTEINSKERRKMQKWLERKKWLKSRLFAD